jgi:protocatechuate 3,4-dioxygenase beta subunit
VTGPEKVPAVAAHSPRTTRWRTALTVVSAAACLAGVLAAAPVTAAAAEPVAGGAVAGTVTGARGEPLDGACVRAADEQGDSPEHSTATLADGTYLLEGLPAGGYYVTFSDCRDVPEYRDEIYDSAFDYDSADLVQVPASGTVSGIDASMQVGGTITGTVRADDTGQPLADVCVEAFGFRTTLTDASGSYRLGGLSPGRVAVQFRDCSDDPRYAEEYYRDTRVNTARTSVSVTAGGTVTGIDAGLAPGGRISGTITDATVPGALGGICVDADPTSDPEDAGGGTAVSSDDGRYTLKALAPGLHFVRFYDCTDPEDEVDYVTEFHLDTREYGEERPVAVSAGGTTSGVDAALDRGGRISGTVTDSAGAPMQDACVDTVGDSGFVGSGFAVTGPDGTYVARGLAPGTHVVTFRDCSEEGGHVGEHWDDTRRSADADEVTVAAGSSVQGIDAQLALAGSIRGKVVDAGTGAAVSDICVTVEHSVDDFPDDSGQFDVSEADGSFSLDGLAPGDHLMTLYDCSGAETDGYAFQFYDRTTDSDAATLLRVLPGTTTSVTPRMEQYVPGQALISGTVTDEAGNGLAGAAVYTCEASGRCVSEVTDARGDYVLSGLADGGYQVVASPPSGRNDLTGGSTRVTASGATPTVADHIVLRAVRLPPPGTTVGGTPVGETPVLRVGQGTPVSVQEPCANGGTVTVTVTPLLGGTPYVTTFSETSPGVFTGDVVVPFTGPADVVISQDGCPSTIAFNIYIDPSGNVLDQAGAPIAGATVTLLRSDSADGPFTAVPHGSSVMDPGNRTNPDTTDATGHFGWNVVAGFYKVRAAATGCTSPADPAVAFVETQVYAIPPPVVDIKMVLDCDGPTPPPASPTAPAAPATPTATAGDGRAEVSWTAPADGGSPITGYTVTAAPGGQTCTTGGATSCTVTGLANGTPHTFTVRATNAVGTGPASPPSAAVTPVAAVPPPAGPPPAGPAPRSTDAACPPARVPANRFSDVPNGSTHERSISCLVWWGVANGRTATTYAPSAGVTRDAMAAFVARAILKAKPGALSDAPPDAFGDDGASVHQKAINQLAAAGIVGGTGGGNYSPSAVVTRGQMARFLANAAKHVLGQALPVERDLFSDDATSVFQDDINRVAEVGITGGRGDGTYNPTGPVLRDQMGSFLARSLDLFVSRGTGTPPA